MRRIFGAQKKKEPAPTLEQAGDRLNSRGDRIDEQINKLDQQLMKFREQIKKTRPGPAQEALKKRALTVLRQKRMYEGQRETLYNQQFNMEATRFQVESIQDTVQTVQALKAANSQMKGAMKANKELDLSFIDSLQDELADMADLTNEINEAMGQNYAIPDDVDEADLMAELDALEGDLALEDAVGASGPSYLQADLMAELDALEGDLALEDAVGASGPSYLQVRQKRSGLAMLCGCNFGLLGVGLDALEGDLALEDAVGASGPSYLQVAWAAAAGVLLVCCCGFWGAGLGADLMAELDALEGDLALEDAVEASGPSYLQLWHAGWVEVSLGQAARRRPTCRCGGPFSFVDVLRWLGGGALGVDLMAELDALEGHLALEDAIGASRLWCAAVQLWRAGCGAEPELELPTAPQQDAEEELGLPAVAQKT
uniref:Charged multivesicular body protein 5 n=1 Tax=Tetradesmus obliquus TaxID=3088 RepID=A0A383VAB0_TETOB|eukprot:jgi/Sobl393_1/3092/SZX61286.1